MITWHDNQAVTVTHTVPYLNEYHEPGATVYCNRQDKVERPTGRPIHFKAKRYRPPQFKFFSTYMGGVDRM